MKKLYAVLSLTILLVLPFSFTYGQDFQVKTKKVANKAGRHIALPANYSPNLNHEHDGEHCITDAITNDWIQQLGIEDQYKADEIRQAEMAKNMSSGDRATYTIPIIFHIIHNTDNPAENVSTAAIYNLLDAVNLDFSALNADIGAARTGAPFNFVPANADIEFCLAKRDPWGNPLTEYGIDRVETTEDFYDTNTETNKMKSSTGGGTGTEGWDRTSYVNVWVCDISNGAPSGTAGYAYKPTISTLPPASIDGIVIDYNLGIGPSDRVLTHEIGHYLGLSHTWGNSNSATGCADDDGLADTPNTAGPSFDYPGSCSGSQQTCPSIETQYENYMDYAGCTVMYTVEQANLMQLVLGDSRLSLNSSDGCLAINPVPPVADFVADITTVIETGSVNFTDLSTDYPTVWAWTTTPSTGVVFIGGTTSSSQNPVIQFANAGLYTIQLTASNGEGSDDEIKTNYINVIASGGGAIACDTLRNYTQAEEANLTYYGITGADGYYPGEVYIPPGANAYQMQYIADSFFVSAPTEVRRIYLPILQADDMGAANDVIFTVWNAGPASGGPGTVIGTQTVSIANLNAGFWNEIDFTTPVPVNGEFWVGAEFQYNTNTLEDTVIFATTLFTDRPSGPSSTWSKGWEPLLSLPYAWQSTTSFFVSNPDCSMILDVLTSNGPPPSAVVSFPTTETCEGMSVTMNGYGSLNTSDYYWNLTDGTDDYFFTEANLTTSTFTVGNWTINLEVDGSCMTDISPDYFLTVNPPMSGSFTVQNENCVAADGEINFSPTGGDGGPYNYSINSGATFEATGLYTGLVTGAYNYIITDNNNCELLGTVTVGNDNTFNPTITPDATILPGTPTDLTVTGGVAWTWYDNIPIEIGTTQTINVAPTVTTTYICNVVDASGCEAELTVTLTMTNGLDDVGLADSFSIYPNPTSGNFALIFNLNGPTDLNIEIVNILGDRVFVNTYAAVKDQTVDFNLNNVAKGVYFVVITSGKETVSKKIVIRK